jgi:hypothetical protein
MTNNSVAQKTQEPKSCSQTIIILSNGDWVKVPAGTNPDVCRRQHEARLRETMAAAPLSVLAAA